MKKEKVITNPLNFMSLETSVGMRHWKLRSIRKKKPTRAYYPTPQSRNRLEDIINKEGADLYVNLSRDGQISIELYPETR